MAQVIVFANKYLFFSVTSPRIFFMSLRTLGNLIQSADRCFHLKSPKRTVTLILFSQYISVQHKSLEAAPTCDIIIGIEIQDTRSFFSTALLINA